MDMLVSCLDRPSRSPARADREALALIADIIEAGSVELIDTADSLAEDIVLVLRARGYRIEREGR